MILVWRILGLSSHSGIKGIVQPKIESSLFFSLSALLMETFSNPHNRVGVSPNANRMQDYDSHLLKCEKKHVC